MDTAIILAAGIGSKIWPYNEIRPKCMLPVANKPLLRHQIEALTSIGIKHIRVAANHKHEHIKHHFRVDDHIEIINVGPTKGSAETLSKALEGIQKKFVLVLHGDTYYDQKDLKSLLQSNGLGVMVGKIKESSSNHIGCNLNDEKKLIREIHGHSRNKSTHKLLAFSFPLALKEKLQKAPYYFPNVDVGMMPPEEAFLEAVYADLLEEGIPIKATLAEGFWMDLDKPWHLLQANYALSERICQQLTSHELEDGASIDKSAHLEGYIRLGKNSSIGRNVVVEGNLWVGDNTHIGTGAFIRGQNCIGDNSQIGYGCYVERGSVIGDKCKVLHGAELSGVLLKNVYLYHYMEIAGIVGENTDIGAGTVCGSLRFDDALQVQRVKGRKEYLHSQELANACYIGDHCRTGINAILLPGSKMGSGSILGPGVILSEDLENDKILLVQQNLVKKDWSPDKYGW